MEEIEAQYQIARNEYFEIVRRFKKGEASEQEVNEIRNKKDDLIKEKKKIRALEYYHTVIRPDQQHYDTFRERNRISYHLTKKPVSEKKQAGRKRILKYAENGKLIQNSE